jgi:hypothetical protein
MKLNTDYDEIIYNYNIMNKERERLDKEVSYLQASVKDKDDIIYKTENIFESLMKDISIRKERVIENIKSSYDEEILKIKDRELRWETKEIVIKDLLSLQSSQIYENFLINSKNILEGLEFLSEDLTIQTYFPYIDVNTEFKYQIYDKGSSSGSSFIRVERRANENCLIIDKDKLSLLFENYISISKGVPMEMTC